MKRFVAIFLLAVLAPLQAAPRNIVLIVADDLGLDLGAYGNEAIQTPNLDRLAKEGSRFTHAFASGADDAASRSAIFSGRYRYVADLDNAHGEVGRAILPNRLRELGYRTAVCGEMGAAVKEAFEVVLPNQGRSSVAQVEEAEELLAAEAAKPFFLYWCPPDAGRSGEVDEAREWKPDLFGNRRGRNHHGTIHEIFYEPDEVRVPPYLPETPAVRAELAQYYQAVSRLDRGVGRLIELLKETGHWDDTLIVFTSDHGPAFPGAKASVYEPGLHVPLLVRNPYQKNRAPEIKAMVSHVDLTPTLLDFAGDAESDRYHGRSWLGVLENKCPKGWDAVYAAHTIDGPEKPYAMRTVRDRKFKLIHNLTPALSFPVVADLDEAASWRSQVERGPEARWGRRTLRDFQDRPEFELYDLENDPDELSNLAEEPSFQDVLTDYRKKLREFRERTDDPAVPRESD